MKMLDLSRVKSCRPLLSRGGASCQRTAVNHASIALSVKKTIVIDGEMGDTASPHRDTVAGGSVSSQHRWDNAKIVKKIN